MAVPSWNLAGTTDVMLDSVVDGNFSAFGGGAGGLQDEDQYWIEGTDCQSKDAWANALRGMMHDENGTDLAVGTDEAVMVWQIYHVPNSIDTLGMRVMVGTSTTVNWYFTVGDATSLLFETWVPWVVNFDNSLESGQNGSPSAAGTVDWVGGGVDVTAGGPTKGAPFGIDAIRYGRFEMQYRAGEAADYNTFAKTEAYANANARRWGVLEARQGTYLMQGFHSFGDASNAVDFRDSDVVLFIRDTPFVTAGFNRIEIEHASTNVDWSNIVISSLGTQSPGTFVVTSGAFDADACQFIGMGTFDFLDSSSATNCIFTGCDTITAPGTDLSGSQVLLSAVTADTGAVVWNVAQDPDGELDDMTFVSHATTAHHAIEFGTSAPLTMTLRGITFTDFVNTIGNSDTPLLLPDTGSDVTWTINAVGCTGITADGYKKARSGDTVNIVIDPRTLTIEIRDNAGALITDATEVTVVRDSDTVELYHAENVTTGSTDYQYTFVSEVATYVNVLTVAGDYVPRTVEPVTLIDGDQTVVVQLADDRVFSNPT